MFVIVIHLSFIWCFTDICIFFFQVRTGRRVRTAVDSSKFGRVEAFNFQQDRHCLFASLANYLSSVPIIDNNPQGKHGADCALALLAVADDAGDVASARLLLRDVVGAGGCNGSREAGDASLRLATSTRHGCRLLSSRFLLIAAPLLWLFARGFSPPSLSYFVI